jgi:hypothetical protein
MLLQVLTYKDYFSNHYLLDDLLRLPSGKYFLQLLRINCFKLYHLNTNLPIFLLIFILVY